MNIVSMVLQHVTPALIGKLGSGSGTSQSITEKLVKAAVPVVLGALVGKASKADGAKAIFDILGKQDGGLLGRLGSVLGGPQQKTMSEQGSNALGSLFGASALGSIVGDLAKYAGSNAQQAGGLVGMLAPIILATLRQQQVSAKLDAGGVAKLLDGQRANIAAMIPADLSKMLGATGLLDQVMRRPAASASSAMAASTGAGSPDARSDPAPRTSTPPASPRLEPSTFNGWPWVLMVGLASVLWASLFSGPPSPWATVPAPPQVIAGATDVAGELDGTLKRLHGLMANIRDRNSAEAALPQFRRTQSTIDHLADTARQLGAADRQRLAGYVASWLGVIRPLIAGLTGNTQAGPVLKPILDGIQSRLEGLAKT